MEWKPPWKSQPICLRSREKKRKGAKAQRRKKTKIDSALFCVFASSRLCVEFFLAKAASSCRRASARQPLERLSLHAHVEPLARHLGADRLVEPDRRLVPVEDLPHEPRASL